MTGYEAEARKSRKQARYLRVIAIVFWCMAAALLVIGVVVLAWGSWRGAVPIVSAAIVMFSGFLLRQAAELADYTADTYDDLARGSW